MTQRPTDNGNHVGLAPPDEPVGAQYERDFYSWLMEQARLVREGRCDALDRENLAEEIESLGREQFNKLESALRVLLTHILKWDHQPARRSRSWALSIRGSEPKSRTCSLTIPASSPDSRGHCARLSPGAHRSGERDRP